MANNNTLYYGDNLYIIQEKIERASVDLIYLDPPFNSARNYNIIYKDTTGNPVPEQTLAFSDTWELTAEQEANIRNLPDLMERNGIDEFYIQLWNFWLNALRNTNSPLLSYLFYMTERLIVIKPLLKPTGSIYLHCDPTASHYIKIMMDGIFGQRNFRNEIIWKRINHHSSGRRYGSIHDTIFFYTMSDTYTWNRLQLPLDKKHVKNAYIYQDDKGIYSAGDLTMSGRSEGTSSKSWRNINPGSFNKHWIVPRNLPDWFVVPEDFLSMTTQERLDVLDAQGLIHWPQKKDGVPRFKRYLTVNKGMAAQDVFTDIAPLQKNDKEKLGYPTQKPTTLLKRIISASSNEGDVVFDPFCGCGTTIYASQELKRNWIGCDIAMPAIKIIKNTLYNKYMMEEKKDYKVTGLPVTAEQARELFKSSPISFQTWIIESVQGIPTVAKSGDRGIDGKIWFYDESGKMRNMVISVKGGETVTPSYVRDLRGVLDREEDTVLAGFLSLAEQTKGMRQEAATAGMYECNGESFPRIQLLTAKEILEEDKTLKTPKRLQLRESKIDTGQHMLSFGKKKGNKET
jgi:DNA modification methylase